MKIKTYSSIHFPRKMKMNKKGFPYEDTGMFFLCWLIILVGIVIGISVFFLHQADIRSIEAKLLAERLVNAVIDNQGLNQEILLDNFNLLEEAGLDRKVISNGDFYVELEIFEKETLLKSYKEGTRDFDVYCELEGEKLPKCYSKEFFIDSYKINIVAASNQL